MNAQQVSQSDANKTILRWNSASFPYKVSANIMPDGLKIDLDINIYVHRNNIVIRKWICSTNLMEIVPGFTNLLSV